jgi:hypothetical protein
MIQFSVPFDQADRVETAEREGFEPSVELLVLRTLSKRLPSATRSPLQGLAKPRYRPRSDAELCNDCGSTVNVMKKLSMRTLPGIFRPIAASLPLIATCLAVLLTAPSTSHACKCAPPPEVAEALAQSSAVFEGQVTQVNTTETELEVSLRVTRAWKGVDTETVRVRTRKDSAACGVEFSVDQVWLVYANQTTEDAAIALQVLRCGRSRLAADAGDDLTVLGLGVVPVAPREPAPATSPDAGATKPADSNQPKPLDPAANGCASCAVGRSQNAPPALPLLLLAAVVITRAKRRSSSRSRTSS